MKRILVITFFILSFSPLKAADLFSKNGIQQAESKLAESKTPQFRPKKYIRKFDQGRLVESLEAQFGSYEGKKVVYITYITTNRAGTKTTSKYVNGVPLKMTEEQKRGRIRSKTIYERKTIPNLPKEFAFPSEKTALTQFRQHLAEPKFDKKSVKTYQRQNILTEIYERRNNKMILVGREDQPYPTHHILLQKAD